MDQLFPFMAGPSVNNFIASVAALIALGSVCVAILVYARTEQRERRIEKSSAYLELEVNSSDAFRYQADNAQIMHRLRQFEPPLVRPPISDPAWEITLNYYFQCLNLFEVCSNFRRHGVVQPEVFASWLAWFYDILKDWYFRELWLPELRNNYTRDVRNIFDVGVEIFEQHPDEQTRLREFYKASAHLIGGCRVVATWLDEMDRRPIWPPTARPSFLSRGTHVGYRPLLNAVNEPASGRPPAPISLELRWNVATDKPEAAAFAGRVIGQSTSYISHGEIQTALSPDGETWAPDLAELYAQDFAQLDDRDLLTGRTSDGSMAAMAVVAWEESPRRKFAVLEDLAVDPGIRSTGIGSRMIEAIVARAQEKGVEWIFLESGLRNERAHAFFKHHGFAQVSHVFVRRLSV